MSPTGLDQFWYAIGWVLALNREAFRQIANFPSASWIALALVLLAGLSLAIGQSVILFINRVKPWRFFFSLLLNAFLFLFGFLFLALSTWLICLLPWSVYVPFPKLITVLGLGYAPLLFSFLGALPYFGVPILSLLSVWNLLAIIVGFAAIANIGAGFAFGYIAFGWFVKYFLENTIGQPIARFSKTLSERIAGVDLADSRAELRERLQAGVQPAQPIGVAYQGGLPEVRQLMQASGRSAPEAAHAVAQNLQSTLSSRETIQSEGSLALAPTQSDDLLAWFNEQTNRIPQLLKLVASLLIMAVVFVMILALMHPIRTWIFGWYTTLPNLLQLVFDLVWIGVVAIVFAGVLAPLESLGWWAGWYGEDIDTSAAIAPPPEEQIIAADDETERYIVYLDGIGQSGSEYTPDVEDFLTALEPALPKGTKLIRGLMMYSVLNKPLNQDRPLAWLWKTADKMRWSNPAALLGIMVNLRNVIIVAVSSDKRYGPIYNQGIAQVIFDGLIQHGYQPGSGVPITLIGYSGGGEMSVAAGPYLRRSTGAPIEVISLGGVMSANNNLLKLEHLYHIIGEKDSVEKLGPIMFIRRWKLFLLSYWNRAKRKGKITIMSAGPVGHQVPGGYMDPKAVLPNGKTNLQHTIEIILSILSGAALRADHSIPRKKSNYALYQAAAFNQPGYYPIAQSVDPANYRAIAPWMGRLILPKPEERLQVKGVWFEVYHAPEPYQHLVGQVVRLRWSTHPLVQKLVKAVTKDVHFSVDAEYSSQFGGSVHPDRINHWRQVGPLESLAGSRPVDDMVVMLDGQVDIQEMTDERSQNTAQRSSTTIYIAITPIQITGRFCALVKFLQPIAGSDQFRVVHYNRASRQFDGPEETVRLPAVILAEAYGSYPSTTRDLEKSPFNETGWYIYGAQDAQGTFVVQALGPRALFRLQPQTVIFGKKAAYTYIRKQAWADAAAHKGEIASVLCIPASEDSTDAIQSAIQSWKEGDRALVIHTYGGIGGNKKEPAAATPIFFGHFAYGLATVIRDPLSDELIFDLRYHQVYTQNTDGLIAGTLHWSRYMGDRQFGWVGTRPTCDILIKLDAFTNSYSLDGTLLSPLTLMLSQLQVMTARYRIGDGTGGTYVGPANNCSQDSNQALFASLHSTNRYLTNNPQLKQRLINEDPNQARRFADLEDLANELERELQPLGGPRSDWEKNEYNLGSTLEDQPLRNLLTGLGSWRTMLPRLASDTIVRIFLKHGATVWVLRTNQIGGYDPDIEPIAPMTL